MDTNRRAVLAAGAGALAALAGCTGGGSGGDGGGDADPTPTRSPADGTDAPSPSPTGGPTGTDRSETPTGTPTGAGGSPDLPDHPALAAVDAQPTLGELSRPGVIVAFEDPSCTLCARFERKTLPTIRSKLVDTGKAAFVWRGYPVVYQWGQPATQALEATFDRDEAAFWALATHYFENQGGGFGDTDGISSDNVLSRTRQFLDDETDVDGAAVVDDVEAGRFESAVETDLDAGMDAGAGTTTPSFFLFRDGEFRTKVAGPQDYSVFASALGF